MDNVRKERAQSLYVSSLYFLLMIAVLYSLLLPVAYAKDLYVDPGNAKKNDLRFRIQGEYTGSIETGEETKYAGVQLVHVREDTYVAFWYTDGLPADSRGNAKFLGREKYEDGLLTFQSDQGTFTWKDGQVIAKDTNGQRMGVLNKTTRKSPTLGKQPPNDALHLFDGSEASLRHWKNGVRTSSGYLMEGTHTKHKFQDFTLHVEFRLPFKPNHPPVGADRGNSGIYIFNNYEIQLLDSFGLPYMQHDHQTWKDRFKNHFGLKPPSDRSEWCGALYGFRMPRLNASYPPLSWQTLDITFRAPRFENGEKTSAAQITVRQNGVLIHKNLKLPPGTGAGRKREEVPRGAIYLQDHNNPIRFKNIWIAPGRGGGKGKKQYKRIHQNVLELMNDGDFQRAKDNLNFVLQNRPEDPETHFFLAIAHGHLDENEKASEHLENALDFGLPPGRVIVGPRDLLDPLKTLKPYKQALQTVRKEENGIIHGPMLGSSSAGTPAIWVRTDQERTVRVMYQDEDGKRRTSQPVQTKADQDYTGVIPLKNLSKNTQYKYSIITENTSSGSTLNHSFNTFPGRDTSAEFTFAFGGCAGYTPKHERIWDTIRTVDPLAVFLLGDNAYIDHPHSRSMQRYCYYRRQSRPEFQRLVSSTRLFSIWDDHDFATNDSEGGPNPRAQWKLDVLEVFKENWANPGYAIGDRHPGVWHDVHIGDVHFILLDTRYHRHHDASPPTMLGSAQKKWLKRTLKNSKATFKILVSSVPWDYRTKGDSPDTWNGFHEERDEIFSFLRDKKIEGVVLMSSDRHRSDAWRIDEDAGKPSGLYDLYEFNSGRLTNIHTHEEKEAALFSYNDKPSFGRVDVNTNAADPSITYRVINIDGETVESITVKRSQLE